MAAPTHTRTKADSAPLVRKRAGSYALAVRPKAIRKQAAFNVAEAFRLLRQKWDAALLEIEADENDRVVEWLDGISDDDVPPQPHDAREEQHPVVQWLRRDPADMLPSDDGWYVFIRIECLAGILVNISMTAESVGFTVMFDKPFSKNRYRRLKRYDEMQMSRDMLTSLLRARHDPRDMFLHLRDLCRFLRYDCDSWRDVYIADDARPLLPVRVIDANIKQSRCLVRNGANSV